MLRMGYRSIISTLLVLLYVLLVECTPSIYLVSPQSSQVFTLTSTTPPSPLSIPLSFQIFDLSYLEASQPSVCIEIKHFVTAEVALELTCLPIDLPSHTSVRLYSYTLTLPSPTLGSYLLHAILKDSDNNLVEATKVTNLFIISDYASSLPDILYLPNSSYHTLSNNNLPARAEQEDITILIPPDRTTGEAYLNFQFRNKKDTPPPASLPTPCVQLQRQSPSSLSYEQVVSWTCLKVSDRNVQLRHLPPGRYLWQMRWGEGGKGAGGVSLSKHLVVAPLSSLWPVLSLPYQPLDFVANEQNFSSVGVKYEISGVSSALSLLSLAVSLEQTAPLSQTLFTNQLLPLEERTVSSLLLSHISPGDFQLTLSLVPRSPNNNLTPSTAPLSVSFLVRMPEDFRPSYLWQPLRAWHRVPVGAETRLPIGGEEYGHKEARIPQPWRLQLPFPKPCHGYFLRLDIMKDTSLREIREAGWGKCGTDLDPRCFQLVVNGEVVGEKEGELSAEQSDLFNVDKTLRIDPACVV